MSTTIDWVRGQIASILEIDPGEIGDDDSLLDHGLDSMRVVTLIEGWRGDGFEVSFADLVADPTVANWAAVLDSRPSDG